MKKQDEKHRNTGSEGKQSRLIQARLHPSDQHEKDAIAQYDDWVAQGYSPREIITHCILHAAGFKPEMFRKEGRIDTAIHELEAGVSKLGNIEQVINAIPGIIQAAFEDQMGDLLKELKRTDPQGLRAFANKDDSRGEVDLDPEFRENASKAARKSFKQRLQEKGE